MKKIHVGINGLGRIGRTILREYFKRLEAEKNIGFEIVAVNNPGNFKTYVHLLKYDSVHGTFPHDIKLEGNELIIENKRITFYDKKDPAEIPWKNNQVDIVIDCTGIFKDKPALSKHLGETVKKVIMCAPGKGLDGTFVMGINNQKFNPSEHNVISNASCTTNCLAPVAKVLNDKFGIESGFMTTIHSYTNDQSILDQSHSDLRRARAAAMSMVPTSTGAAKALGEVIPELAGKLDGYAVRVPTPNVSMVDLTVTLKQKASIAEINKVMKDASENELKGILGYTTEELVSIDFMGCQNSSTFDSQLTNVIGNSVKVVAWYDNEAGFSNRVIDLAQYVGEKTWG